MSTVLFCFVVRRRLSERSSSTTNSYLRLLLAGFGDDPSDLDNLGWAEQCFEDCYVSIYKVDGHEWALKLREAIEEKSRCVLLTETVGSNLDSVPFHTALNV